MEFGIGLGLRSLRISVGVFMPVVGLLHEHLGFRASIRWYNQFRVCVVLDPSNPKIPDIPRPSTLPCFDLGLGWFSLGFRV